MNALYDAMLKTAPPASAVGESIVAIVQSGELETPAPARLFVGAVSSVSCVDIR